MSLRRRSIVLCALLTACTFGSAHHAARAYASGPTCGGVVLYKSSGVRWQCTFDDEFTSTTINANNWLIERTAVNGLHTGPECFVDSPANVYARYGALNLTVRKEAKPFVCLRPLGNYVTQYTSGMVSSFTHFSQTYGRFEVRAQLPRQSVAGLQETFWLWPNDSKRYGPYPASGEIDWAEFYSQYFGQLIPYIHYNAASTDPNVTTHNCYITDPSAWHKYALIWTPTTLTVLLDGRTCLVDNWNPAAPLTKPQPFDQPFYVNLTQALGSGNNAFDATTAAQLPATTKIDYVRVWK